jgi:hypothetical protein
MWNPSGIRVLLALLEGLGQAIGELLERLLGFLDRQRAAVHEPLRVPLADRALLVDLLVHQRLCERGLVGFVVSPAAVAPHVDHDVLAELATER